MHDRAAAGRRRADLNSDQSQLVRGPLCLSPSFGVAVLTLGPWGVLLVIGSTGSDGCRAFFLPQRWRHRAQSAGALTAPEVGATGDTGPRRPVIYPITQQINDNTWNKP